MPSSICSGCTHYVFGSDRGMCESCRTDITSMNVASSYDSKEVRAFKNELIRKIWEDVLDIDQIITILED